MSQDAGLAYNADRAIFFGIPPIKASYLLGIVGISNIIGKLTAGQLTDRFRSRIFTLTFILMLAYSIIYIFSDYFPTWIGQAVMHSIFGFSLGAYSSIAAVLFK